jgi:hypothetical protein
LSLGRLCEIPPREKKPSVVVELRIKLPVGWLYSEAYRLMPFAKSASDTIQILRSFRVHQTSPAVPSTWSVRGRGRP